MRRPPRRCGCRKAHTGRRQGAGCQMVGQRDSRGPLHRTKKRLPADARQHARITEEAARLDAVFAVESVDVHLLCTPELKRARCWTPPLTKPTAGHCIFDPGQPVPVRDGQTGAYQAAHRSRWLEVIGSQLRCRTRQDCRIEADGKKQNAGRAGDMDYSAIRALSGEPCARSTCCCCAMRLFCPPTPPMCGICAG